MCIVRCLHPLFFLCFIPFAHPRDFKTGCVPPRRIDTLLRMRIIGGNVSIKDGSSIVMAVAAVVFLLLLGCNLPQTSHSQCVELSGTCATWLRELYYSLQRENLLSDGNCEEDFKRLDCACLFNYNITVPTGFCKTVHESLGLNCSSQDDPVSYVVNEVELTEEERGNLSNRTLCVIERVCQCLSRPARHNFLLEIEETCHQYCLSTGNSNQTSQLTGGPLGSSGMCSTVHSHYCRRHRVDGRPQKCAAYCAQEDVCVSLINCYC